MPALPAPALLFHAFGQRVEKNVGGTKAEYIYGNDGSVAGELNGSGNWQTGYVYVGSQLLAEYSNSTTYFAHSDHLGSTRVLTDINGSGYDNYDYLPFGETRSGGWGTTHKFTGDERDSETGLDHTLFRQYSSSLGRWSSPDPLAGDISDPQSLNRYAYVEGNPIDLIDPYGLSDENIVCTFYDDYRTLVCKEIIVTTQGGGQTAGGGNGGASATGGGGTYYGQGQSIEACSQSLLRDSFGNFHAAAIKDFSLVSFIQRDTAGQAVASTAVSAAAKVVPAATAKVTGNYLVNQGNALLQSTTKSDILSYVKTEGQSLVDSGGKLISAASNYVKGIVSGVTLASTYATTMNVIARAVCNAARSPAPKLPEESNMHP